MQVRIVSLSLIAALAFSTLASAADSGPLPPSYSSAFNAERPTGNGHFVSPEDHARPGEVFFIRGVNAVQHGEYRFAADMYKVAASWAFKPAQYNLAVMYMKGEGVPVDRPLAMAWAALAAERGDKDYVDARELIYAEISKDEFAKANAIWRDLKKTYGDDVALQRARGRWAEVRNNVTGSHVGSVGHLLVGNGSSSGHIGGFNPDTGGTTAAPFSDTPFGVSGAGTVDGSIAYRQLHDSRNPYDPKFEHREGEATVQPLVPLPDEKTGDAKPHNA